MFSITTKFTGKSVFWSCWILDALHYTVGLVLCQLLGKLPLKPLHPPHPPKIVYWYRAKEKRMDSFVCFCCCFFQCPMWDLLNCPWGKSNFDGSSYFLWGEFHYWFFFLGGEGERGQGHAILFPFYCILGSGCATPSVSQASSSSTSLLSPPSSSMAVKIGPCLLILKKGSRLPKPNA